MLAFANLTNTYDYQQVVKSIVTGELDVRNFSQHQHHPKATDSNAIEWIFIIDTLNFCFWTPGDAMKWRVDGETGYFALCAAINRAQRNGIDITNAQYYSKITLEELTEILRGDDDITKVPLLDERVKCLHEAGSVLLDKYEGKFENVLKEADHSAKRLLRIVTDLFPSYRDEAEWYGIGVSLYKRAQILIGDLVRIDMQYSVTFEFLSFKYFICSGPVSKAKIRVILKISMSLQCLPIIVCHKRWYILAA